jgi:hypothetical protein
VKGPAAETCPGTQDQDWRILHRFPRVASAGLIAALVALLACRSRFPAFVISGWCAMLLAAGFSLHGRLATLLRAFLGTALILCCLEVPGILPWSIHTSNSCAENLLQLVFLWLLPGCALSLVVKTIPVLECAMAGAIYCSLALFHRPLLCLLEWMPFALHGTLWLASLFVMGWLVGRALVPTLLVEPVAAPRPLRLVALAALCLITMSMAGGAATKSRAALQKSPRCAHGLRP